MEFPARSVAGDLRHVPLLRGDDEGEFVTANLEHARNIGYVRDLGLIAALDPVRMANSIYAEVVPRLLQAYLQRIVNGGGRIEREYGLGYGRTDLLIVWPFGASADGVAGDQDGDRVQGAAPASWAGADRSTWTVAARGQGTWSSSIPVPTRAGTRRYTDGTRASAGARSSYGGCRMCPVMMRLSGRRRRSRPGPCESRRRP